MTAAAAAVEDDEEVEEVNEEEAGFPGDSCLRPCDVAAECPCRESEGAEGGERGSGVQEAPNAWEVPNHGEQNH